MDKTVGLGVNISGTDNLSPVLKQLESGVIRFVGAVSSALTAISVVGFPVKASAEFERSLLDVKKTTDFTNESLGVLRRGLVDLSRDTNVTVTELARIAALGGQMGVGSRGPEGLLLFTEELARAVTALDVDADLAAKAMGKLINIFDIPMDSFRNSVAVINQLSNTSTASAEEMMDIMRRMGDLGGAVSYAQSAALAALAIDIGLTAETAGTTFTKIFADMRSEADAFAAFMGISTSEWVNVVERDGVEALTMYLEMLNRIPSEVAAGYKVALTGGGRIFETITKLQNQLRQGSGSRMAFLLKEANDEWVRGTSAVREQENVLSGLIAQWDIFKNRANAVIIAGGDRALGPLADALDNLGSKLEDPEFVEGFVGFIDQIVSGSVQIANVISTVYDQLQLARIDWSTIFDIAGLVIALKLINTLPTAARLVGGALAGLLTGSSSAAGEGQASAYQKVNAALTQYANGLINVRQIEVQRNAYAKASAALVAERTQAEQRAFAIQTQYSRKLIENDIKRAEAKARLAALTDQATAAEVRAARAAVAAADRSRGGINSYYGQKLAAEQAIIQQSYDQMESLTAAHQSRMAQLVEQSTMRQSAALRRMSVVGKAAVDSLMAPFRLYATLHGVVTNRTEILSRASATAGRQMTLLGLVVARVNAGLATMAGVMVPANVQLGLMGRLSIAAAAGINATARAFALLQKAGGFVLRVISRFFTALIIFDMVKMVLEWIGVWDDFIGLIDSAIEKFNKFTGLSIPTFNGVSAEEAKTEALREEIRLRDEAYARAEAYQKQFGTVAIDFKSSPDQILRSIEVSRRALEDFRKNTEKNLNFKIGADVDAASAFLDGARAVEAMNDKVTALREKLIDLDRQQNRDNERFSYDPLRIRDLEAMERAANLTVEQEEELARLRKQRDDGIEAYLRRQTEVRATMLEQNTIIEEQRNLVLSLVSSFDGSASDTLFGGGNVAGGLLGDIVEQVKLVRELRKQVDEARKAATPTQGREASVDAVRQYETLNNDLQDASVELEGLKQQFVETEAASKLAGKGAREFIDSFTSSENPGAFLFALQDALAATGQQVAQVTRGLSNMRLTPEVQNQLIAQMVVSRRNADAFGEWGKAVGVAAEQAKNAVAQFAAQARRDLEGLREFFRELDYTLADAAASIDKLNRDEGIDAKTDDKLFEVELERKKKLELLEDEFDLGNINYEQFLRKEREINKEYDKRKQKIEEAGELQKAQADAIDLRDRFGGAVADARALIAQINQINDGLRGDGLSDAEKDALIDKQRDAAAQLETSLARARDVLQDMAAIDPVGGELVVGQADIDPLKKTLEEVQRASAAARQAGLIAVNEQLASLATSVEAGRKNAEDQYATAVRNLQRFRQEAQLTTEQMVAGIVEVLNDPEISAAANRFSDRLTQGLTDFSIVRFDPKQAVEEVAKVAELINTQFPDGIPLDVTTSDQVSADISALREEIAEALRMPVTFDKVEPPQDNVVYLEGDVEFSKEKVQESLDAMGEFSVNAIVNPVAGGRKDGGYIIPERHADGGHIRGPGTSRSDSILSWLSHGEYVMDALTVRMFGPGFFKFLQSIAKRGTNLSDIMPSFADGGMLSSLTTRPFAMSSGPTIVQEYLGEVGSKVVDEMVLDLRTNGAPRSKVRGSRQQISDLVDAIRELKRGG